MNESLELTLWGLLFCAMFAGLWHGLRGSKSDSGSDSPYIGDGNGDI